MALDVTALCEKHNTDKCRGEFPHSVLYDTLFQPFRNRPIKLLEIGINRGRSIGVWEDYFPQAELLAVDINSSCMRYNTSRTQVSIVDQSDATALKKYAEEYGSFDIIIDDGSHKTSHQILTFETLWPYLKPGGLYVVEDTLTSYDDRYIDSPLTCVEYFKTVIDSVHLNKADRPETHREINTLIFKQDLIAVTKI